MEKAEGRVILKRLQKIVNFKGDEQAESVIAQLRSELATMPEPCSEPKPDTEREETGGHDRQERGGRTRKGRER